MRPGTPLALDQHHPVRAPQVVVKRIRPGQGALVIGPGQQVVHQVPPQPQFGVGDAAQPASSIASTVAPCSRATRSAWSARCSGSTSDQDPDQVRPWRHQQDQPLAVPDGFAVSYQPAEQMLALGEGFLRVRIRLARACPGGEVAVPVLDRDRHAGELMQRLRDARLALSGYRHPGEPVVNIPAAPQARHGLGQHGIGRRRVPPRWRAPWRAAGRSTPRLRSAGR